MHSLAVFLAVFFVRVAMPMLYWRMLALAEIKDTKPLMSPRAQLMTLGCFIGVWCNSGSVWAAYILLVLVAIALIDARTHLIPDSLHIAGAVFVFMLHAQGQTEWWWHAALLIMVCGVLLGVGSTYSSIRGAPAMGLGDIKLIGWLILWGGESMLIWLVAVPALILCALLLVRYPLQKAFPFGPCLALAALMYLLKL